MGSRASRVSKTYESSKRQGKSLAPSFGKGETPKNKANPELVLGGPINFGSEKYLPTNRQEEKHVSWDNDVMEPGIIFANRPKLSEYSGEVLDVKK